MSSTSGQEPKRPKAVLESGAENWPAGPLFGITLLLEAATTGHAVALNDGRWPPAIDKLACRAHPSA
jgi:hypothetical protein